METNNAMDETIDTVINDVLSALEHPQHVSSIGDTYDLSHLITEFGPLLSSQPEDSFVDLLESIIQESSASPVVSERQSVESNPVSPKRSFWSRLFNKKSHDGVSLPSVGSGNDSSASDAALKAAEAEVESLEASGPADLTCLSALSRELNRKICVWSSGMSLRHESGAERSGEALNVQFHSQPEDIMGHWSLLGDSDPQEAESGLNDCLFNAIAAQTGIRPSELRGATVARMKTNIRSVARRIQEIARQEACDRIVLMVGGARYVGKSSEDAARILDNSQCGLSYPDGYSGHPRGHASNPEATGRFNSAENYSLNPDAVSNKTPDDISYDLDTQGAGSSAVPAENRLPVPENPDVGSGSAGSADKKPANDDPRNYWKAGFLSVQDQNNLAHFVLSSPEAQKAMERLNNGTVSELVRFKPGSLPCKFPMGAHFNKGSQGKPNPISELIIILKHHLDKNKDPDHDVFVFTFYPRVKKTHWKPRSRMHVRTKFGEYVDAAFQKVKQVLEMEQNMSDESIEIAINHVHHALDHPQYIKSTGETNDLAHVITEVSSQVPASATEDPATDLLETIIQESSSSFSAHQIVESNSVSPKRSFWSKLFAKKSHDEASIASIGSGNDSSASSTALKAAEEQVAQLEASGPADLTSVSALSREINRKICVWSSGMSLRHEVGASRPGAPLNVQFHSQPEDIVGHWSLLGNLDPQEASSGLNDCLFNAIAAQTGLRPTELREATVARMKTNIRSVARRIQDLARQESCNRIVLMVGGAKYEGKTPEDAGRLLHASQYGKGHPSYLPGHPRGHASNPKAKGVRESVENYSISDVKSGFLSVEDQNHVANLVLNTNAAKHAMMALNAGCTRVAINVPASVVDGDLPQAADFADGIAGPIKNIKDLVLVLQHHAEHYQDPEYDVFIHSFYPRV